jgi:putative transposase
VLTEVGPIPLEVPAIAEGEFQPQIIPKHARRSRGSARPSCRSMPRAHNRGIRAQLAGIYGVDVSRDLISRVNDRVTEELAV